MRLASSMRTWAATLVIGSTAAGAPLAPVGALAQQGATTRAPALESYAARYVLPPVVVSGWTAPPAAPGIGLSLASRSPSVVIDGTTLSTPSSEAATARITATLVHPASPADTVVKQFEVTVLPAADARHLLSYTRTPLDPSTYGAPVAHSMHLALGATPGAFQALNENYGVLFAKAVPTQRIDFTELRTLKSPYVFYLRDGTFGVVATRALADGSPDAAADSSLLYFTSPDLRTFTEVGLVDLGTTGGVNRPRAVYDSARDRYLVWWTSDAGETLHTTFASLDQPAARGEVRPGGPVLGEPAVSTDIEGAIPSNVVPVTADVARALEVRFGRIRNVGVEVPDPTIRAGEDLSLEDVKATLIYSDGSTATRAVDWDADDLAAVDLRTPGTYPVEGTVRQTGYEFPFIRARADPTILAYRGRYYFIATDDTDGGHVGTRSMAIRAADTILGLRTAPEHVILTTGPADIQGCFWAPELHELNGTLHVFFAPCIGQASWSRVQSHVMRLKPGGDPTRAADWEAPRPVLQRDGTPLQLDAAHPGISLDMTYFEVGGTAYVAWSQRYIVGEEIGDAEIWTATIDPADPYRLTSEPAKIVTAEYGWDHNLANVAEGPFVVRRDGTVYMTYSGSAVGPTYVTGLVTAPVGADLTDPAAWSKRNYPVLKTDVSIGQWGPGHNIFTRDEDGNLVLVYHAKSGPRTPDRHTALRRVHWAADGMPILDMTEQEEVAPDLRRVVATVTVLDGASEAPAVR